VSSFETCRTNLEIHPDGNVRGTLGCIGLETNAKGLNEFYKVFTNAYNQFNGVGVNVNIQNNPNNSNCRR
jgi:hypothetical protein